MKKLILLLSFLLAKIGFAQVFVTTTNFPTIGVIATYHTSDTTGVNPPVSGLGQTFNYSSIVAGATNPINYIDPTPLWCQGLFPSSTVVAVKDAADWYYDLTIDTLFFLGNCLSDSSLSGTFNAQYLKPAVEIFTNMNYNQVYNDSAYFEYNAGIFRKQLTSFQVMASGTLQLPSATYTDVFVLKKEAYVKNSSTNAETEHYLDFLFYDSLVSQPLFKISYYSVFGAALGNKTVSYADITSGIDDIEKNETFQIYPNPFINELFIATNTSDKIKLYDVNMKQINFTSFKTANGIQLQLNGLEKGIYFISINRNGLDSICKIIKM